MVNRLSRSPNYNLTASNPASRERRRRVVFRHERLSIKSSTSALCFKATLWSLGLNQIKLKKAAEVRDKLARNFQDIFQLPLTGCRTPNRRPLCLADMKRRQLKVSLALDHMKYRPSDLQPPAVQV